MRRRAEGRHWAAGWAPGLPGASWLQASLWLLPLGGVWAWGPHGLQDTDSRPCLALDHRLCTVPTAHPDPVVLSRGDRAPGDLGQCLEVTWGCCLPRVRRGRGAAERPWSPGWRRLPPPGQRCHGGMLWAEPSAPSSLGWLVAAPAWLRGLAGEDGRSAQVWVFSQNVLSLPLVESTAAPAAIHPGDVTVNSSELYFRIAK